jgi:hypothetical protein
VGGPVSHAKCLTDLKMQFPSECFRVAVRAALGSGGSRCAKLDSDLYPSGRLARLDDRDGNPIVLWELAK